MTPDSLGRLLFDDIPYLKRAREEHDEFARILRMNGVEVIYLEDLMTEVLDMYPELKEKFIKQYVYEAGIKTPKYKNSVIQFLMGYTNNKELVLKTMEGININELHAMERDMEHSLVDLVMEGVKVREIRDNLENILEKYLKREITLIPCGGGNKVISEREQWNDGSNTLCIAPGVVIVYDRNNITNAVLRRYGIKVIEMPSSELLRGRGGPRCMSMPLIREDR